MNKWLIAILALIVFLAFVSLVGADYSQTVYVPITAGNNSVFYHFDCEPKGCPVLVYPTYTPEAP